MKTKKQTISHRRTKAAICGALMAAFALAGCNVNDPVYNTAHPETGQITFATDFSQRAEGVPVPAQVMAKVGSYSATLPTGNPIIFPNLIEPGSYKVYLYNTVAEIPVIDKVASVRTVTPPAGAAGTYIEPLPGWLFTGVLEATVEKDTDHEFTVPMKQQVREITFTVTPTGGTVDKIASITGTLGGVAGTLDIDTDTRGGLSNLSMTFTKITSGADAGKWQTTVRLLGIVGDSQPLTTKVVFIGGDPGDMTHTTDINDLLDDPEGEDPGDIDLGTEIVETPTGAGVTTTIKDWTPQSGGSVIAN